MATISKIPGLLLGTKGKNGTGVNGIRSPMISQHTTARSGVGAARAAPTWLRSRRYDVVLSNTPPEAFSLRASSAYSDSIWRRSKSPVLASGIEIILRPLR